MTLNGNKCVFSLLFIVFIGCLLIAFPTTALQVYDPDDPDTWCPFDAEPGESISGFPAGASGDQRVTDIDLSLSEDQMETAKRLNGEPISVGAFLQQVYPDTWERMTTGARQTFLSQKMDWSVDWTDPDSMGSLLRQNTVIVDGNKIHISNTPPGEKNPAAAVYVIANVNDPYDPSCPFEAPPGEEILYGASPDDDQGMQCISVDMDNPLTIGQYIQDQYPDIWDMLSPVDQEYYNTMWAVWHSGAAEPTLPDKVGKLIAMKLLAINQPTMGSTLLQHQELNVPVQYPSSAGIVLSFPAIADYSAPVLSYPSPVAGSPSGLYVDPPVLSTLGA